MIPLFVSVRICQNYTKWITLGSSDFLYFERLFQEGEEDSVSSESEDSADSDDESEDGEETNDDEAKKNENCEEKEEAELRQVERMNYR